MIFIIISKEGLARVSSWSSCNRKGIGAPTCKWKSHWIPLAFNLDSMNNILKKKWIGYRIFNDYTIFGTRTHFLLCWCRLHPARHFDGWPPNRNANNSSTDPDVFSVPCLSACVSVCVSVSLFINQSSMIEAHIHPCEQIESASIPSDLSVSSTVGSP